MIIYTVSGTCSKCRGVSRLTWTTCQREVQLAFSHKRLVYVQHTQHVIFSQESASCQGQQFMFGDAGVHRYTIGISSRCDSRLCTRTGPRYTHVFATVSTNNLSPHHVILHILVPVRRYTDTTHGEHEGKVGDPGMGMHATHSSAGTHLHEFY